MNINNITIAGRLTNDPELTFISEKNTPKATFRVAVNRIGTDKTDFISVEVFGTQAENCEKYLIKGQEVGVTGSLRIDNWQKEGNWNSRTYIVANNVQFGNKPGNKPEEDKEPEEEPEPVPF